LEGGEEVLFRDGWAGGGAGLTFASGDGDGGEFATEAGASKHIDYRRAYAGGVNDERALAGEGRRVCELIDFFHDAGVGDAERIAFGAADQELEGKRGLGVVETVTVFEYALGTLDDAESGVVLPLAEVDADIEHFQESFV